MTPSQEHYNAFNQADFVVLVPEHPNVAKAIGTMLGIYASRKRCRNVLINHDLMVKHNRILQIERDDGILTPQWLYQWGKEDADEDTQIIERPK